MDIESTIQNIKINTKIAALMEVQLIIQRSYNPEENADMNDLYCHLDHMIVEIGEEYE